MIASWNRRYSSMHRPKCPSPGWTAFDLKQREKGTGAEHDVDPFPAITNIPSSGPTKSLLAKNYAPAATAEAFSSAAHSSLEFPLPVDSCKSAILHDKSARKYRDDQITPETIANPGQRLSDIHSWADESLIEDILTAVNNDLEAASILLQAMVSPYSKQEDNSNCFVSRSAVNYHYDGKIHCSGERVVVDKWPDGSHEVLISGRLLSVPVEPEWEEDDIYLSHRKDARKKMRAVSQYSRAASNAFSRGDRVSAHQLSLWAQEERMSAEKLNAEAAEEILRIRNKNNDVWKLDLHGLHATEAASALKEHLNRIESQISLSHLVSSDSIERPTSFEPVGGIQMKEKKALPNQRLTVLQVITGTGNHSRGQAALPIAVRSFLSENCYRFDDARPGVIAVHPKFRK